MGLTNQAPDLLPGTLDLLILRTLVAGFAQAEPVVARWLLEPLLLGAHLVETLGRAPAVVGAARLDQLRGVLLIQRQTLGLAIRRIRAALVRALVPLDPQPVQTVVDLLLARFLVSRAIGVLDAQ